MKDVSCSIFGREHDLKQALWYFAKAFQMFGLFIVLFGIITGLSDPQGDEAFKAEFKYAITGMLVFGVGWLMERTFAKR
jgi:hypothetical protein